MNITVSKEIISRACTEDLNAQIEEYLNSVIDDELQKEDCDTDLIDACIDALDAIRKNNIYPVLKVMLQDKDIIKYCKRKTGKDNHSSRKAIAACLIVALLASAAFMNTDTALARQIKDTFSQIIEVLNTASDSSDDSNNAEISSIYAAFPQDYSFTVKSKDDININNMAIYAVYKDGSEKNVPVSDCTYSITQNSEGGKNQLILAVAYKGCAFSVIYNIEEGLE